MNLENLTNAELIRMVDNLKEVSPLVQELANRLDRTMLEIKKLDAARTVEGEMYDPRPV